MVCRNFTGSLTLLFLGAAPQRAGTITKMGTYLEQLGLNSLTHIAGSLAIRVNTSGSLSPAPFLPNLTSVAGDLDISENNALYGQPTVFSQLSLQSLRILGGSLRANLTGLASLSSFSALRCIGRALILTDNLQLQSLTGLEGLSAVNSQNVDFPAPSVILAGNPLLTAPSAFRPLSLAAGCGSQPAPNAVAITVVDPSKCRTCRCPKQITTFGQLCSYIGGSSPCPT